MQTTTKNKINNCVDNKIIQGKYYLKPTEQKLMYKLFEEVQKNFNL